jgi:glycosyltransferase involved in cell wall biosynthesis
VCFFSHLSQLGGAERSLLELVKELIEDYGVICSVVLPQDGPLGEHLANVGASTLIFNYSWWCDSYLPTEDEIRLRLNNGFQNLNRQIRQILMEINPDIIVTNTIAIPWGAIAGSLLDKPHVWFIREFGESDHDLKFFLPFNEVINIIKESSNFVITNSNAIQKTLFGTTSGQKILTIYRYIDIPCTDCRDERNIFTKTNAIKLLIIGRIAETKGQKDAIFAVKELIKRKKDIELIIMGAGDPVYIKELKEIVKDGYLEPNIKFLDFMENPYPVIKQADIVLMCSRQEAFGRAILESMLLKKPVIGTNSGGTPELIKEKYNGLLYEYGDYRQLANKIEYLIDNTYKIKEFGENGYKYARENFSKENYGGKVYNILNGLKNKENSLSSPSLLLFIERMNKTIYQKLIVAKRDKG